MSRRSVAMLIVLNVVLIAALAVLTLAPQPAQAQLGSSSGNYIMVAGDTPGKTADTIYITDIDNGATIAVTYDQNRGLVPVAGRDLSADFRGRQNQRRR